MKRPRDHVHAHSHSEARFRRRQTDKHFEREACRQGYKSRSPRRLEQVLDANIPARKLRLTPVSRHALHSASTLINLIRPEAPDFISTSA
jgi:hypothetical protein